MKPITVVINTVFLSTLLTACGGSGGGSGDGASPPSGGSGGSGGGGSPDSFTVGGNITGNINPIALSLNGNAQSFSAGSFTFSQSLDDGTAYDVQFVSSGGANESCTVQNASGSIAGADITNIIVECAQISSLSLLQYDHTAILGALAAGDFNGDGHDDLAFQIRTLAGHPAGNDLYFIRYAFGNGLGSFASVFDMASECDRTLKRGYTMLATDFDGDSFDDLVCRGGDTGLEIMRGRTQPVTVFTTNTLEHGEGYFHAADVNADGLPDIFDLGDGQGSPAVEPNFEYFLNDGSDDFGAIQSFAVFNDIATTLGQAYGANRFVVADANGDLREDLITIGGLRGFLDEGLHIAVFVGNPSGGFELPLSVSVIDAIAGSVPFEEYRDLAYGDFNADGHVDLAVIHDSAFVQILLGDGLGGFTDNGQISAGRLPVHIGTADFNGDSALDLVTINEDSHDLFISFGFGDGTFGSDENSADEVLIIPLDNGINPYDLVISDFDQNALPDIAIAESALRAPGSAGGNGSVQIIMNPGQ